VAALEPGRTSWTAVLDAIRLGPGDDEAEVTAAQVREVITRLISAGHWREGDPPILVIFDAGYDPMRLACQLADLPAEILGRLRSDRVLHFPVPQRRPGTNGRPLRHGRAFASPTPPLAADLRLPWERPAPPGRLTPARVRRGFRNIHATLPCLAGAPKPGKPGPGRPPGSKNRRPAPRWDVGKITTRERTLKSRRERAG